MRNIKLIGDGELYHFNPYHDKLGRFASKNNSVVDPVKEAVNRVKKTAKTRDKVEDIINTLSKDEKIKLGMNADDHQYLTIQEGEHVIHRYLKEIGDVPVSFFDLLDDGDTINLAFATRSGKDYRGKGYGSEAAKQALNWLDKHPNVQKGRDIIWGVKTDNKASIAVAEKMGFKRDESSYNDGWINYVKKGYPRGFGEKHVIKDKDKYIIKNKKGQTISKLNFYEYKLKNKSFDWSLIANVETNPDYRKRGLASKLINSLYKDMDKKNKGLYLFVSTDNNNAIDLYKKLGFDTIKSYDINKGKNKGKYYIMTKGKADRNQLLDMKFV